MINNNFGHPSLMLSYCSGRLHNVWKEISDDEEEAPWSQATSRVGTTVVGNQCRWASDFRTVAMAFPNLPRGTFVFSLARMFCRRALRIFKIRPPNGREIAFSLYASTIHMMTWVQKQKETPAQMHRLVSPYQNPFHYSYWWAKCFATQSWLKNAQESSN